MPGYGTTDEIVELRAAVQRLEAVARACPLEHRSVKALVQFLRENQDGATRLNFLDFDTRATDGQIVLAALIFCVERSGRDWLDLVDGDTAHSRHQQEREAADARVAARRQLEAKYRAGV